VRDRGAKLHLEEVRMESKSHWEHVYEQKAADAVSWYSPHLAKSLGYIRQTGLPPKASIIDVGGGESTLVDDLLQAGYMDLSVLDISKRALEVDRARLGERQRQVDWIAADVLQHDFAPAAYDIWHDRAVFHFMTGEEQRRQYVRQVLRALKPNGFAIVGAFGPQGPTQCSGLPVARYSTQELHDEFGARFLLVDHAVDVHMTPWGTPQQFVYCFCRREH
jgi:SAM-dependent methyltransferase